MKKLLAVVGVLLLLLLVADRVGKMLAEQAIAEDVMARSLLTEPPDVEIPGFPFLTQAIAGRYDTVLVSATDVDGGQLQLARLDATLTGVRLPLSEALDRPVMSVPVDRVTATAFVTYDELAQRVKGDVTIEPAGERVRVFGTVEVLGFELSAAAVSRVEAQDGDIVVTAEEFDVGNRTVNRALNNALRGVFDFRVPVTGLPYGLTVSGVDVRPEGLEVRSVATDTDVG